MCSEIFSRKINYSSCNLSSFKDKSVRQIFWKAILEQNDSVRFSDGWSESKSRTFYFLTSSFSRICLFRFSADNILTKSFSSESRIRTRDGEDSFERATSRVFSTIYMLAILFMPPATFLMTLLPSVHTLSFLLIGFGVMGLALISYLYQKRIQKD